MNLKVFSSKISKFTGLFLVAGVLVFSFQNCSESSWGGSTSALGDNLSSEQDTDGDGLSDAKEAELGTKFNVPDTDGDGLTDGQEVNTYGTDPLDTDTDDDDITDGQEVNAGTDPNVPNDGEGDDSEDDPNENNDDPDEDGLTNTEEAALGTLPDVADTDKDGLSDGAEVKTHGTDPLNPDTDHGGVTDGAEVRRGTNPKDNPEDDFPFPSDDPDQDGLTNSEEADLGTEPFDEDTDGDGLKDGDEVKTHNTDPLKRDTDGGGVDDGAEISAGTEPVSTPSDDVTIDPSLDTDGDGLKDVEENSLGTDPTKKDTDRDGLTDGAEVNTYNTDPLNPDTDGGGALDGYEVSVGSNAIDKPVDDLIVAYIDLKFIKTPVIMSEDTSGEFIFDVPTGMNLLSHNTCQFNSLPETPCSVNQAIPFQSFAVGEHVFKVTSHFKTGHKMERVYRWLIIENRPEVTWSPWSNWYRYGSCVADKLKQVRERSCIVIALNGMGVQYVAPSEENKCDGPDKEYRDVACNSPVDGGWSGWGPWGDYSNSTKKCGVRMRTRTCTYPTPAYGGNNCAGSDTQISKKTCPAELVCQPALQAICPIVNGSGIKTCNSAGSAFSACIPSSCSAGYSKVGEKCVKDLFCKPKTQKACSIANGAGAATCNNAGSAYGACVVASCKSGYKKSGNKCVKTYTHQVANIPYSGATHAQTCASVGSTPASGANCFSGEVRINPASFPLMKDLSSVKYIYGTWGGYGSTAGTASERFCYRPGQKRDNDRTDLTVAYLCKP